MPELWLHSKVFLIFFSFLFCKRFKFSSRNVIFGLWVIYLGFNYSIQFVCFFMSFNCQNYDFTPWFLDLLILFCKRFKSSSHNVLFELWDVFEGFYEVFSYILSSVVNLQQCQVLKHNIDNFVYFPHKMIDKSKNILWLTYCKLYIFLFLIITETILILLLLSFFSPRERIFSHGTYSFPTLKHLAFIQESNQPY